MGGVAKEVVTARVKVSFQGQGHGPSMGQGQFQGRGQGAGQFNNQGYGINVQVSPGADMGMTYMLDRVNNVPMKISWSIYNKVKHLYGEGHIPEIAAQPGDDTLYVSVLDRVN